MKSILFLVPKMSGISGSGLYNAGWTKEIENAVNRGRWNVITPSVLLLAAIALEEAFEVDIVDEEFREIDQSRVYHIVCIYTVTPNVKRAYRYADKYRKEGTFIAIGGVHSSVMYKEASEHCDTIMIGEGEYTFRQFLTDYRSGTVKKSYVQKQGTVKMKDSPIPLYNYLNTGEQKLIPVQTARGCPHNCNFCNVNSLYGKGFRAKECEQIVNELVEIKKLPAAKKIYITNDNLLSSLEHFNQLTLVLKETAFTWYANTDISFGVQERYIRQAYDSGLRQVLIGFESIIKDNLYQLDTGNFKFRYLRRYKELIENIQSNGVGVVGSFMVGQLHDTEETFKYLEEFIYETKLYGASVTVMTPYPGTKLFYSMKKEDRITTYDWDYYTIFQPVIKADNLSMERVNELYLKLLEKIMSKEYINNKVRYFTKVYKELL
jgi:radical SAM superfamily enzyme YgiQ (UPF0313 family)